MFLLRGAGRVFRGRQPLVRGKRISESRPASCFRYNLLRLRPPQNQSTARLAKWILLMNHYLLASWAAAYAHLTMQERIGLNTVKCRP